MRKFNLKKQTTGRGCSYKQTWSTPPSCAYSDRAPPKPDRPDLCFGWSPVGVLENYRQQRENGDVQDSPDSVFPGLVLEEASRAGMYWGPAGNPYSYPHAFGFSKWPDQVGRYWWEITHKDGATSCQFYWKKDMVKGYPDANGRYWFTIHHASTNTCIEGFSYEPDKQAGFPICTNPDRDQGCTAGNYEFHYFIQYTESGAIAEWMKKKDENFLNRLKVEEKQKELSKQKVIEDAKQFRFAIPWVLPTNNFTRNSISIPANYHCPLTHEVMWDPVLATDGYTYEREAVENWLKRSTISPMTGKNLPQAAVFPNFNARSSIREFLTQNPQCWDKVYVSNTMIERLLVLSKENSSSSFQEWKSLLQSDQRLLYLPLGEKKTTLLEHISKQSNAIIKLYLPEILELFTAITWRRLATRQSVQDWLMLVANMIDRASISLSERFFKTLQTTLNITICPIDTALYAINYQNVSLFKLVLPQISDINQRFQDGNTLLHFAALNGETNIVTALLDKGANIKQKNDAGLKPESMARQAGHEEVADLMAMRKIAPLLQRAGIFKRITFLEERNQELESRLSIMEKTIASIPK